jgi:hypothetical protein
VDAPYDIFVSYSHQDRERVKVLVAALAAEGWNVFWDRTIPPGESWRSHIGAPLAAAPVVVVCWSKDSVESDWVCQEADAAAKRKVLMPVFLDSVTPPLGLAHIHAADLVDWTASGGGKLPHVLKLAIVRKLPVGGATAAAAAIPAAEIEEPKPMVPKAPPAPAPAPPAPSPTQRTGLYALIGGAVAVVAALAIGSYFLLAGNKPAPTPVAASTPPQQQAAAKHTEIGLLSQAETRDAAGKITTEAATIHVIACANGSGGGHTPAGIYVYEYTKRAGFRAVQPPNWGTALGGKEFATLGEAIATGCAAAPAASGERTQPPTPGVTPLGPPHDNYLLKSGDILRYYGSPSEAACRADCEREGANCQSYTWVKPEGYQKGDPPVCYLMKTFGQAGQHKCCVTATRGKFPAE